MSLREMGPKLHRPFRGTMLKVMAPLSFVLASLAIYWAMANHKVILIIILDYQFISSMNIK